jgi:hypothetical protein
MARFRTDGSILMDDGRVLYADSLISAQDFIELSKLFAPAPPWPFVSGGGGGGPGTSGPQGPAGPAGSGGGGGGGSQGAQGPFGTQGTQGPDGGDGSQGAQGAQGPDGGVFPTPTLAQVLAAGNVTGPNDILVTAGQALDAALAGGTLNLGTALAAIIAMGNPNGGLGTFELFINQGGVALHGSNSGIQYSSTVANRAQIRENQYGANVGVPGISTFKSRGATVGALAGVIDGDVIFRATAVGVCGDNVSIPLSGLISILVPVGGSNPGQNWIATDFEVQLVPLAGPINGRKITFKVDSEGILYVREAANKMAGIAVLDATGTAVVANTRVKATTRFNLTVQEGVAPTGSVYQSSRIVGTSFTIKSNAGAADAGVQVYYQLWEPTSPA